jgi:RNA-directed DNA polymerase
MEFEINMEKSEKTNINEKSEDVRSSKLLDWQAIDWHKVDKAIAKLQARIVKAQEERRYNKVKALSRIMTRSFSAKATAVKQVTSNKGAKSPGVDGITWNTPQKKTEAIGELEQKGYKAKPLRRVYIEKSNGKKRPLGIPTMKDRAMQALYLLALDPVAECTADKSSYGFRRKRSCADAEEMCFMALSRKSGPQWILEGDIKGCFDNISHDWLLANIPIEKRILKQWLKAGYMDKNSFYRTEDGTPQGGIISPALANLTLDGLEELLFRLFKWEGMQNYHKTWGTKRLKYNPQMNLIRYADDFIITCRNKDLLEKEVKPAIEEFMKERGLTLSPEKTLITHIDKGFDFLGFNFRKYNGRLFVKPSKRSIKKIKTGIREVITQNKTVPAYVLIGKLNSKIRGWCNYHKHVVSSDIFCSLEHYCWQRIWSWSVRRHRNKGKRWIHDKYFCKVWNRSWVFFGDCPNGQRRYIFLPTKIKIVRHIMGKKEANPYDPKWREYYDMRDRVSVGQSLQCTQMVRKLWMKQKGICPMCNTRLNTGAEWGVYESYNHVHHIRERQDGGGMNFENLVLLHDNCHNTKHAVDRKNVPGDNNEAL